MKFWEITKQRAIVSLEIWRRYLPELTIGIYPSDVLSQLIDGFEPLVQAHKKQQRNRDKAAKAAREALATMRLLGVKVAMMIDCTLSENASIMKALKVVFPVQPREEAGVLSRLRLLLPVWARANEILAGIAGGLPPIIRAVKGVAFTEEAARALLDSYPSLIKAIDAPLPALESAKKALLDHDKVCDKLSKRFYKCARSLADDGTELMAALKRVRTEPGSRERKKKQADDAKQGAQE